MYASGIIQLIIMLVMKAGIREFIFLGILAPFEKYASSSVLIWKRLSFQMVQILSCMIFCAPLM
ncbi:MAG: hypothetical protein B7X88_24835 [Polaromonas sp. 17-63-33]|nr:MAG: hypothetical protein B7Y60_23800 [Polaromonas sp. 35-63-35]OYZ75312.1 MAG: hypothetical protein B7Y09_24630 [Polaromonas sp. 24-63-21]OZA45268.1 MAG: hypothetical protein B7X88_24835 [Polaromonas sp. 17-63-33]